MMRNWWTYVLRHGFLSGNFDFLVSHWGGFMTMGGFPQQAWLGWMSPSQIWLNWDHWLLNRIWHIQNNMCTRVIERKNTLVYIYIYNENTRYHHPTIIRHSMHWACKPLWKWGHDHSLRWDKKTTLVQETKTCPILDTQSSEFSRLEFRIPSR